MKFENGGSHWLAVVVRCLAIAFVTDQCLLLGLVSCETVQVNYTSSDVSKSPLPDDVDVTISTDNDTYTVLHLKRVPHITADIPVDIVDVDSRGLFVRRREKLEDRKNIGYYQDSSHEAVIQITRTNDLGESTAELKMEGMLHVSGAKHSLLPEDHPRLKRSTDTNTSSSDNNLYVLQKVFQNPATGHDYLEPPPEIKVSIPMSNYQSPSLTTTPGLEKTTQSSAKTSFSSTNQRRRRQRRDAPHIVINVVAIIDYGAYKRFLAAASGSKTKAISDIQEYYAFIFNGVNVCL